MRSLRATTIRIETSNMNAAFRILAFIASLTILTQGVSGQTTIDNPVYKNWNKFPVGTSVSYRSTTTSEGFRNVQEYTLELKAKGPDRITIEKRLSVIDSNGIRMNYPAMTSENPRQYKLSKGATPPSEQNQPGLKGEGEEELEIIDRKIKTRWFKATTKVEAGEMDTQSWSSDEVPGGLVKAINATPATGSVNTVEIIGLKIPE